MTVMFETAQLNTENRINLCTLHSSALKKKQLVLFIQEKWTLTGWVRLPTSMPLGRRQRAAFLNNCASSGIGVPDSILTAIWVVSWRCWNIVTGVKQQSIHTQPSSQVGNEIKALVLKISWGIYIGQGTRHRSHPFKNRGTTLCLRR